MGITRVVIRDLRVLGLGAARRAQPGAVGRGGLTTRAIAELLFVTPETLEFQLGHLYEKLHIASRSEIADALADRGPR